MELKKIVALFSSISLVLILAPPLEAQSFSDVSTNTNYSTAITSMKERGVIEGYPDGSFKPSNTINRAEFLKIVLEGRGENIEFTGKDCFPDVKDEWFAKYVCTAKKREIIAGYPDGTFKPGQEINFVEATKIIALAYGQDITNSGNQWYEGYVSALEGSKVIPPSIASLDGHINRGEMVEMMWRLADKKTDQPSKGMLNIKYPKVGINLSSDRVQYATSCEDIRAFTEEANVQQNYGYGMMDDGMARPMMMRNMATSGVPAPTMDSAVAESSNLKVTGGGNDDYSATNVQVEGVDEADIVKTDGTYIYIVRNQTITVAKVLPADQMEIVTELSFTNNNNVYDSNEVQEQFNPQELYIDSGQLVILGNYWKQTPRMDIPRPTPFSKLSGLMIAPGGYYPQYYSINRAQARIYAFNGSKLEHKRTVSIEGNQVSSRRIGNKLYLVLNQGFYWNYPMPLAETRGDAILPKFSDSAKNIEDQPIVGCNKIAIVPHVPQPQYLIVATIPLDNHAADIQKEVIVGNGENVYSSLENLYIANTNYNYIWNANGSSSNEETNIYRFALLNGKVEFKAQGKVPGHILNQFSMDEHNNSFRIATTKGNSWDENNPSTNNLYVLNMDLDTVGKIEGIAPGETIYSVRFMGDRTYMVTFKKVDPFFVLDTSDPRNPTILGKLKIPGYSDYLHPYDENHIIGFGKDATESKDGNFAWYQGMKIALFDVSNVENPTQKHMIEIGDRGTESPILHNHKALLFDKERNLLAFPITVNKLTVEEKAKDTQGNAYGTQVFQGAHVYDITLENGFKLRGTITHYTEEDKVKLGSYFYGKNIDRILRIKDSLFSVSQAGIQSHTSKTITKEGEVKFPNVEDGGMQIMY